MATLTPYQLEKHAWLTRSYSNLQEARSEFQFLFFEARAASSSSTYLKVQRRKLRLHTESIAGYDKIVPSPPLPPPPPPLYRHNSSSRDHKIKENVDYEKLKQLDQAISFIEEELTILGGLERPEGIEEGEILDDSSGYFGIQEDQEEVLLDFFESNKDDNDGYWDESTFEQMDSEDMESEDEEDEEHDRQYLMKVASDQYQKKLVAEEKNETPNLLGETITPKDETLTPPIELTYSVPEMFGSREVSTTHTLQSPSNYNPSNCNIPFIDPSSLIPPASSPRVRALKRQSKAPIPVSLKNMILPVGVTYEEKLKMAGETLKYDETKSQSSEEPEESKSTYSKSTYNNQLYSIDESDQVDEGWFS